MAVGTAREWSERRGTPARAETPFSAVCFSLLLLVFAMDSIRGQLQQRAQPKRAHPAATQQRGAVISDLCDDVRLILLWSQSLSNMQACLGQLETGLTDSVASRSVQALDGVYSDSYALMQRLQGPPFDLRSVPLYNPLLMLYDQVCTAVKTLLLLKVRVAPKLPAEVWHVVIDHVLDLGRGQTHRVCPAVRKYGYLPCSGQLRINLVPITLPRIEAFRSGLGSVMNVVSAAADPQRVAAEAAALLGDRHHRQQTDRVRALLEAFALPLPEHALLSPRVGLTLSVDPGGHVASALRVRDGWVNR